MAWINRFVNLFRGKRLASEIDEELRFHLEARARDYMAAGMTSEEAKHKAMVQFGGRLQAREGSRDADILAGLETFFQDMRYAIRGLRTNPGVTAIAVLSLGLAIGANTAIFSIVNAVLLRALPYHDSSRIAILWTTDALNYSLEQSTSLPNLRDWKARARTFADLAAFREVSGIVMPDGPSGAAEWTGYSWVSANFFDLLGRAPVLGRAIGAAEFESRSPVAVLSHSFWQHRLGGSPDVVGKKLTASGIDFEIIGVMPSDFRFPTKNVQFWLPASLSSIWQKSEANRGNRFGTVLGRLAPAATFDQARVEMRLIAATLARQYPETNEDLGVRVVPLQTQINGGSVPFMLAILFGR